MKLRMIPCLWLLLAAAAAVPVAQAATAAELLADYARQSGATPSAERGQRLFTTNFGREFGWSCSSCHGAVPTGQGTDQVSEKRIAPLAPGFNPKRFSDRALVENRFRQNCKDVIGRECTPGEKADVIAWLVTLKP